MKRTDALVRRYTLNARRLASMDSPPNTVREMVVVLLL